MRVKRYIEVFSKTDERLLKEFELTNIDLSELKTMFKDSQDDEFLYYAYPCNAEQLAQLKQWIPEPIDLDSYDYFLACYEE